MRKHDVRKWLHAALDLLPIILIPVFMIYSHRHDLTERTNVDIQYKYQTNEVNSLSDLVEGNMYHLDNITLLNDYDMGNFGLMIFKCDSIQYTSVTNWYIDEIVTSNISEEKFLLIEYDSAPYAMYAPCDDTYIKIACDDFDKFEINNLDFIYVNYNNNDFNQYCEEYAILPTASTFNVIDDVVVQDTKSSIMSVFMDDFNYSIDKYFNMGDVFNMNGVWNWFNTNIFHGNAPVVMHSVWCIVLYEFVMDLLFLLYGLFMWFIDMVEKIMDKPFKSIK